MDNGGRPLPDAVDKVAALDDAVAVVIIEFVDVEFRFTVAASNSPLG